MALSHSYQTRITDYSTFPLGLEAASPSLQSFSKLTSCSPMNPVASKLDTQEETYLASEDSLKSILYLVTQSVVLGPAVLTPSGGLTETQHLRSHVQNQSLHSKVPR